MKLKSAPKPAPSQQLPASKIARSTTGLRTALFEEMELLRSGRSNAQRARSIALMANSILQSVEVEIEYHKYVQSQNRFVEADTDNVVELGTNIELGEKAA